MQLSCETEIRFAPNPHAHSSPKDARLTLLAIIVAAVIGGLASAAVAAIALYFKLASIERWVAFAVGAMLGVVFLDILPHALSEGVAPASLMGWVLAGVLFFFFLENSLSGAIRTATSRRIRKTAMNTPHTRSTHITDIITATATRTHTTAAAPA